MIKVLWFSNTSALAMNFFQKEARVQGTGGWVSALNDAIKDEVDLSVVFHYPYKHEPFEYLDTKYFPVFTGNIYLEIFKNRFFNSPPGDRYLFDYFRIIDIVKPDIIHIHGTENSFLGLMEFVSQIPVVVSIQGNITVCNHKYFAGFNGRYLNKVQISNFKEILIGPKNFGKSKKFFSKMALIEQNKMKNIRYIIGRTKWDYRITRILSPKSVYFQGEELLRESFYHSIWNNPFNGGKLIVFTTNGDTYYKGIETVFHSIHLLQSIGIDIDWRIAGIHKGSLVRSVSKSFLGRNFPKSGYTLLGSLAEEELTTELLNAHLYVMPSHIENSPNNLCEAMILGIPCIATYAGGTGSLLKDGEEGILIQDGDPWAMSGAIVELMNNANKAKVYGEKARRRALIRHDKERVANQYLNIYKSILQQYSVES